MWGLSRVPYGPSWYPYRTPKEATTFRDMVWPLSVMRIYSLLTTFIVLNSIMNLLCMVIGSTNNNPTKERHCLLPTSHCILFVPGENYR